VQLAACVKRTSTPWAATASSTTAVCRGCVR
jgi:hypothetical protein